ncbi:hypothetical protein FIBSPDRAFT_905957, partial [Athelia psychrophila]
ILVHYHADCNENDGLVQCELDEINFATELSRSQRQRRLKAALRDTGEQEIQKDYCCVGLPPHSLLMRAAKLGQRSLFLTSYAGMSIVIFAQTICIRQVAYHLAFIPVIVSCTVEILPYHLHAKGFNIFNVVISLIVYAVWLAFEGVSIYFIILETKNLSLEEALERLEKVASVAHFAEGKNIGTHEMKEDIDEKWSDSYWPMFRTTWRWAFWSTSITDAVIGVAGCFFIYESLELHSMSLPSKIIDIFDTAVVLVTGASTSRESSSLLPSLAHIEWCNNRKSVCMFISARFLVGMGLSFADIAAPIPVTQVSYLDHCA